MDAANIAFHEKVKAAVRDQPTSSTAFWVAVLHDSKTPADAHLESDILWIKCRGVTKADDIKTQYLSCVPHTQQIFLQHDGVIIDPAKTIAELNSFSDNVVAFEAIKETDLLSRTGGPRQDPLQPLFGQGSENRGGWNETPIKHESLDVPPGDENGPPLLSPISLSHLQCAADSEEKETPPLPIGLCHTSVPYGTSEVSVQGFTTECTLGECMHERVEGSYHNALGVDATVGKLVALAVDNFRQNAYFRQEELGAEFVNQLHTMPTYAHTSSCPPYRLPPITTSSRNSSKNRSEPYVPQHLSLQELFANSSPDLLETAMEKGVELLERLKKPLTRAPSDDVSQWLPPIEKVQKRAVRARTILGVVGNTGSGKSSIINAMLDEERLVPTNCMRACTAVVTEISYNYTDKPYKAEIEFITRQDWEKELQILFQDFLDGHGKISGEATHEDSEARVAYAKIKAVYPNYTKDMLQKSSVTELMQHANVQNVLGGKREIVESDSLLFYKRLQSFVDSKEKTRAKKDKDKKQPKEMEFWPLIKVVRLYVKAAALSTGAVIVDLPGVHDSNAARSAVAEGYIKQCTGLWIVAPINRAVDDKAAKSLLGETFKRQLQMDGGFSTVTFICSKTDDISLMECQESLGLEEEMSTLSAKSDEQADQKRKIERQLDDLKETKAVYADAAEEIQEQLEIWETLKEDIENGKIVFAPPDSSPSKKRKRGSNEASRPRKKSGTAHSDLDSDYTENSDDGEDRENGLDEKDGLQTQNDPLTTEQIDKKLAELKAMKKESRRHKLDVDAKIKVIRKQVSEIVAAEKEMEAEINAVAISGRNEYSRSAIRVDFAAGIKEIDQELAEEQDAASFDPDVEARDYEEVARSLPVFCVSSRGYQKLQGRLKKEPAVPGFRTVQETEIPQLQDHCKKLTEANREAACRPFLNSLSQLLNSLRLWSSNDENCPHLSDRQKAKDAEILQNRFNKLDSELENHIRMVCRELRGEVEDNILDAFENAISKAENEANKTALRWAAPVDRDNRAAGGYFFQTYQALCRRHGVFTNAQGPHNWNAELIAPVKRTISYGWGKTFSQRVPAMLRGFASDTASLIKAFHNDLQEGGSRNDGALLSLQMLSQQLHNYQELFKDLCSENSETVKTEAKEINRMFQPLVAEAVGPAYIVCTNERGRGTHMRMKAHMSTHIDCTRSTMFRESTNRVKQCLEDMIDSVEKSMLAKTDEVLLSLKRDYSSALIGAQWATGEALPREQRVARRDVLEILTESEKIFNQLAGCGPEEDELRPTDACDETWTSTVQECLESLSVKAEGDSGSDMDVDEAPVTSKPGMQMGGGFQRSFRQLKVEDEGKEHTSSTGQHTVNQRHLQ